MTKFPNSRNAMARLGNLFFPDLDCLELGIWSLFRI